jgi:hypothetical protein
MGFRQSPFVMQQYNPPIYLTASALKIHGTKRKINEWQKYNIGFRYTDNVAKVFIQSRVRNCVLLLFAIKTHIK